MRRKETRSEPIRRFGLGLALAMGCGDGGVATTESDGGEASATGNTGPASTGGTSSTAATSASDETVGTSLDGSESSAGSETGAPICATPQVSGTVSTTDGLGIEDARVTVATADLSSVFETRSAADGSFSLAVPNGQYQLGASLRQRAYAQEAVVVDGTCPTLDLQLGPETEQGTWTTISDTAPEFFAGTPSGTLLPDGRAMFCHDTQDSVIIDPEDGGKTFGALSQTSQGCHMQTVLSDGRLLFVGGQDPADPGAFTNGIPYVKTYDPATNVWTQLPDLNEPRWYPTVFRLSDETIVACGGGQPPDAARTDTCEILDFATEAWTPTGSMLEPTEYSPAALLHTGQVLATWSPPQLFDPSTGQWAATGTFVQPNRGFPDHADHSLIVLADGSALIVGVEAAAGSSMVERYAPESGQWTTAASPSVIRSQPEVVALPDGRLLAAGGFWEGGRDVDFDPSWRAVAVADLYDPEEDSWRGVAPMLIPREYHALTLLLPDGRVMTTSGGSDQASGAGTNNDVDVFEPPYLFRGPRPRLESLSTTDLERGATISAQFSRTAAPTAVVLVGAGATTHWVDGGVPRRLELPLRVSPEGGLSFTVPAEPAIAPVGWYILFLMVDDIPSDGVLVRVLE
ncbi:MAG: galactose oxidase-like domain-containing protein [Nannocystales bacterium]